MALRHRLLPMLLLLAFLPVAQAATYGFGTVVAKADSDFTPATEGKLSGLCYLDRDGDGTYTAGEPLYLEVFGTTSSTAGTCVAASPQTDDIRLLPVFSFAAGSSVAAVDQDANALVPYKGPVAHFIRYFDADGDAKFKAADTLYVSLFNTGVAKVSVGDVRLTAFRAFPAGTVVGPSDPDVNMALRNIGTGTPPAAVGFASANVVYKAGSAYYVSTDGHAFATSTVYGRDYIVEENDVRINGKAEDLLGDLKAPTFIVSDAVLLAQDVQAGEPMRVKVTMRNTAKAPGAALVETFVGDDLMDARGTATIAPGKEGHVVLALEAPEEAGSHKLRIGKDYLLFYKVGEGPVTTGQVVASVGNEVTGAEAAKVAQASVKGKDASVGPLVGLGGLGLAILLRRRVA